MTDNVTLNKDAFKNFKNRNCVAKNKIKMSEIKW